MSLSLYPYLLLGVFACSGLVAEPATPIYENLDSVRAMPSGCVAILDDGGLGHCSAIGSDEFITALNADRYGRMNAVEASGSTSVAVGEAGMILRSVDGGVSWAMADAPRILGALSGVATDGAGGWAAVGSDGISGVVLLSTDDGLTWTNSPTFQTISSGAPSPTGSRSERYVDNINGSDANDGLSPTNAVSTFAALTNLSEHTVVYLARGCEWREELYLGDFFEVRSFGEGAAPVINAAEIVPGTSFQPAEGYDHVYKIEWTLESASVYTEMNQIIVDGRQLKWEDSVSGCESSPGSFFDSGDERDRTRWLYLHMPGSVAPTNSLSVIEIAYRDRALRVGDFCRVVDVSLKNNAHDDGVLKTGTGFYGARFDCINGTKHNALFSGHTFLKDVLFYHANNRDKLDASSQAVLFKNNLENFQFMVDGGRFVQDPEVSAQSRVFQSHPSSEGGGLNEALVFRNCLFASFGEALSYTVSLANIPNGGIGYWIIDSEFLDCQSIKTHWYQYPVFFLRNYISGLSHANSSGQLFTGSDKDYDAPGGYTNSLYVLQSDFDLPAERVTYGTFRNFVFNHNRINGISNALYAIDQNLGRASDKLSIKENLFVGFEKPWRFWEAQLDAVNELEIDRNAYLNFGNDGQFIRKYSSTGLTFEEWQEDHYYDLNGFSTNMESALLEYPDYSGLSRPEWLDPPVGLEVGPDAAPFGVAAYTNLPIVPELTGFNAVTYDADHTTWIAVGESGFGSLGCVYVSADGTSWSKAVTPPETVPLHAVVSTNGDTLAVGENGLVLLSTNACSTIETLIAPGHQLPDLNIIAAASTGTLIIANADQIAYEYFDGSLTPVTDQTFDKELRDLYYSSESNKLYAAGLFGVQASPSFPTLTSSVDLTNTSFEVEAADLPMGRAFQFETSTNLLAGWVPFAETRKVANIAEETMSYTFGTNAAPSRFMRVRMD